MNPAKRWIAMVLVASAVSGYAMLQPSSAQSGGGAAATVGVVDIPSIFKGSTEIKYLSELIEKEVNDTRAESDARGKKIKDLADVIERMKPDTPGYEEKQKELLHLSIENEVWVREKNRELQVRHLAKTERFYQTILDAVARLGKEKGLQVVLYAEDDKIKATTSDELLDKIRQRKVLYYSAPADLTPALVARLNAEYKGPAPSKQ